GTVINVNTLPQGRTRAPRWSANSEHLAFIVEHPDNARRWGYSVNTYQAKQLSVLGLNSVLSATPYQLLPDRTGIV
ncbi:hypothetical protein, partial [Pseudoalteromonas sp. S1688]|uniref:hypothetical protein n=1 Tax=Pseudoalteromonas sp. S1688 TaxID=579511 RepID=UPI00110AD02F